MDVYDKNKTRPIWDRVLAGREAERPVSELPAADPQLLLERALRLQAAYAALAAGPCRHQQAELRRLAQQCRDRARRLAAAQFVRSGLRPRLPHGLQPALRDPAKLLRQMYYIEREDAAALSQLGRQQPEHAAVYDDLARQALAHMTAIVTLLQAHMRL